MNFFCDHVLPLICNPKAVTLLSYALVAFVHALVLWTQHVFTWNTRFNCTGIGCPGSSTLTQAVECAVLYCLFCMLLISYWRCILTPAGSPPATYAQAPAHHSAVIELGAAGAEADAPSGEGRRRCVAFKCQLLLLFLTARAGGAQCAAASATATSRRARTTAACATLASCAWTTIAPGLSDASGFATTNTS